MMDGNTLASEVQAAIAAIPNFPKPGGTANVIDDRVLKAFCTAVVSHIQNNADVRAGIISTGTDSHGDTVTVTSQIHSGPAGIA